MGKFLFIIAFLLCINGGETSVSVGRLDTFIFENGKRNILQLQNSEGPWTCLAQNSEFSSYSISIASYNSTLSSNSTQFSPITSCSPLSASGLASNSPSMLIQCLYDSPSFGNFQLKSSTICKNGFESVASLSNSFFFLGNEGSIVSLSSLESNPNLLDSSFNFKLSSKSFKDEENVSGLYFKSKEDVEGAIPNGFEEPYWGSLSFDLDALTSNGFRPSGALNEPILTKLNYANFQFTKEEASRLSLFYLDSTSNSFVSVASSCGSLNYSSINVTEKSWTVKICHLTPYKAFLSSPLPTTAQSTTSDTSTSSQSPITNESLDSATTQSLGSDSNSVSIESQTSSNTAAALGAQNTNSNGLGNGAIIGIVVGVVGGILLITFIILLIVFVRRRKNQSEERERKRHSYSPEALNEMYMAPGPRTTSRTASWIKASGRKTLFDETADSETEDKERAGVRNVNLTFEQAEGEKTSSDESDQTDQSQGEEESEKEAEIVEEKNEEGDKSVGAADLIVSEEKSEEENSENEERSSSASSSSASSQSSESSDEEDELPPYTKAASPNDA